VKKQSVGVLLVVIAVIIISAGVSFWAFSYAMKAETSVTGGYRTAAGGTHGNHSGGDDY
jgi:hypothetical protein